eukprot:gene5970-8224_t
MKLLILSGIVVLAAVLFLTTTPASNEKNFLLKSTNVSPNMILRLIASNFQSSSPVCDKKDLHNQFILLTGGNGGIGYETAKWLVTHGAHVVIVSRNNEKNLLTIKSINEAILSSSKDTKGIIDAIQADLSNLESVRALVKQLNEKFPTKKFTHFIQNAALWPVKHSLSAQGYELSFATNTIGPFLLFESLVKSNMLVNAARVVFVTGDIYITANGESTVDYRYNGTDGMQPYSRSKLAFNWIFYELHAKYPQYWMNLVHPGVISTDLVGTNNVYLKNFKDWFLLTPKRGAQTTLICATASESDGLENGAYYHNTFGKVIVDEDIDPIANKKKGKEMFKLLTNIISPYLMKL